MLPLKKCPLNTVTKTLSEKLNESQRLQSEKTFNPPLATLPWEDSRGFLEDGCSPAVYGMNIQSIYLCLWPKIPLLSESLVERHTEVSFHSLLFV